jgi:phosphoglycerate dehydrogenase-like enzyme
LKILFCGEGYSESRRRLAPLLPEHRIIACAPDQVAASLDGVDVIVPYGAEISAAVIERGTFGLVQQFGVGLETVDVDAATRAGVWVARIPGKGTGNAESVAEHALLLMLALSRRLPRAAKALQDGLVGEPSGLALLGKTACIFGLGDVGRALAIRLAALGMRLTAVRRRAEPDATLPVAFARVYAVGDLPIALAEADYIAICARYEPAARHLLGDPVLKSVKPGAFLINVARGGFVDPEALAVALESGRLAGAGLDVFWQEPPDLHHRLFRQNVIATPHIAGVTDVSYDGIARAFARNIERFAAGEAPLHAVNAPLHPRQPKANVVPGL